MPGGQLKHIKIRIGLERKNMEENNTVIEINQEGQLNGSGPKYRVETNNPQFLKKLPKFIDLHDNLSKNGHIKLHIVADLC